jgi:hypothetical protein
MFSVLVARYRPMRRALCQGLIGVRIFCDHGVLIAYRFCVFSYDEVQYRIFSSIEVYFSPPFFYKIVGPELPERSVLSQYWICMWGFVKMFCRLLH